MTQLGMFQTTDQTRLTNILKGIFPEDVWDDSAEDTARRILSAWREFACSEDMDFKFTTFPATANQQIVVSDIKFSSLCAHHLFPYYGVAHVGYLPNKLMVGLSKIPRVVHHFATRPTTQETLTKMIASFLKDNLEAMGVAVIMEARHTCMACRGIREHDAVMRTSEMRGAYMSSPPAREEFLTLIGRPQV